MEPRKVPIPSLVLIPKKVPPDGVPKPTPPLTPTKGDWFNAILELHLPSATFFALYLTMPPPSEILFLTLSLAFQVTSGDQCSGGSNIFTEIPENSPNGTFVANLSMFGDPVTSTVKLCLSGTDADWFYLDGKNVWLNVSSGKTLDREVLVSSVLLVTLTCSEEGYATVQYRIIVQVLNENDNKPRFLEESVAVQNISELAEVDSVVFTAKAMDSDGDTLMYVIDRTMGDFKYFHMDLPNNGKVLLSRPLDYESVQELEVIIHAVEMTTRERQRTTTKVKVIVLDGDDQYPQFLPYHYMSHDGVRVCVSPTYSVNITTGEEPAGPLVFSPGPIFAEDGDKGIMTLISYSLLSSPGSELFQIDNITGSVSLINIMDSIPAPTVFNLKVMASQVCDSRKYSLAEAKIRVLAPNKHAPRFAATQYRAFVQEDNNPVALVSTYNGRVLSLMPSDGDFPNISANNHSLGTFIVHTCKGNMLKSGDNHTSLWFIRYSKGTNPQIYLSLKTQSNHSQLFQITQSGFLIARANLLQASETYAVKVIARDEESGETANSSVIIQVLAHGQAAPRDPSEPQPLFPLPDLPIIAGGLGILGLLFAILLFLLIRLIKNHRQQQQQMSQTSLMTEKHPTVVNPSKSSPQTEEQGYQNAAYTETPGEENPTPQEAKPPTAKSDGQTSKQQKKMPAVAVISPGHQSIGNSPCRNKQELSAEPLNRMHCTHQEATVTMEHQSKKVGITKATMEKEDSSQLKPLPVETNSSSLQTASSQYTDANQELTEKPDGAGMWPDPPLPSRLPIVVEVNEEIVEPDGELSHPPLGSEIITPGSLMQLLEDSIEC